MIDDAVVCCRYAPNAVDVRWGSVDTRGPLDDQTQEGTDTSGLLVRERVRLLRVPTCHVEDIARNESLRVTKRGVHTTYRVREVMLEDDGEVTVLSLVPA